MKHKTKDEKLLMCIYEMATQAGDAHSPVNRYDAGHKLGLSPKTVNTICQLLLQTAFVKKALLDEVCLTTKGVKFVLEMLEEK